MRRKGKWFEYKIKDITQEYINHISNKYKIKGEILKYPKYNKDNDRFEFGVIKFDKLPKKVNKYQILLEHNDFLIIVNNKFKSALAYMGVYLDDKYKIYL